MGKKTIRKGESQFKRIIGMEMKNYIFFEISTAFCGLFVPWKIINILILIFFFDFPPISNDFSKKL